MADIVSIPRARRVHVVPVCECGHQQGAHGLSGRAPACRACYALCMPDPCRAWRLDEAATLARFHYGAGGADREAAPRG